MTFLRIVVLLAIGALIVGGLAAYNDRVTAQQEAERGQEYLACKLRECSAQRTHPGCNLRCDDPGAGERTCEASR